MEFGLRFFYVTLLPFSSVTSASIFSGTSLGTTNSVLTMVDGVSLSISIRGQTKGGSIKNLDSPPHE